VLAELGEMGTFSVSRQNLLSVTARK
jgi:hypothetical protein